jgi:hypothetical protein
VIGPRSTTLLHRLDRFDLIPGIVGDARVIRIIALRRRIVCIPVQDRSVQPQALDRSVTIPAQARAVIVPAAPARTVTVPAQTRVVVIPREETCNE